VISVCRTASLSVCLLTYAGAVVVGVYLVGTNVAGLWRSRRA
jgi:hypothetical protein